MGKITLDGIEVVAKIGLLEEEQKAPQDLYVTLSLQTDFASVVASDDLSQGIDYRAVIEFVKEFALAYEGKTLERFAEQLADQLMEVFPAVGLHLAVDKPRYTRRLGLREIRVEVER